MVFTLASIGLAVGLSWVVYSGRVIGADVNDPVWNQADGASAAIGRWLADRGENDPIVMVNNPPGFTYQTGLPSIVVPYGGESDLLRAADQFGARWVVLDANRPEPLAGVYAEPGSAERLRLHADFNHVYVFEILPH